jgi:hypothetical protein
MPPLLKATSIMGAVKTPTKKRIPQPPPCNSAKFLSFFQHEKIFLGIIATIIHPRLNTREHERQETQLTSSQLRNRPQIAVCMVELHRELERKGGHNIEATAIED